MSVRQLLRENILLMVANVKRPEYRYEVQYKFSGDCERVVHWLEMNCIGDYRLEINSGLPGRKSDGHASIKFDIESDRTVFRDRVLKGL